MLRAVCGRSMCNRYSPGHGQSPNSVSFLWHDPSRVPPLVQRRIQLSNARAEGSHTFTFSLSLSPCDSFHTPSLLSHLVISPFFYFILFFSSRVLLYFDSALAAHSCISPFMRALSPGTDGVVRIRKRTVIHEPTQRSV